MILGAAMLPYHGWGMGGFAPLGVALLVILSVMGIDRLMRAIGLKKERAREEDANARAHERLRRRYARGEIDDEEYARQVRDLTPPNE
ncbi:MAG: SHOCT domain-containing protein [Trueperaceae bacterium]|nr:SHOCT domain-containing protein [Trueperaceae bacterium]